jgi:PAS domain S-box-containing protein
MFFLRVIGPALAGFVFTVAAVCADTQLSSADAVKHLTAKEAAAHPYARVRGIVTAYFPEWTGFSIQDNGTALYIMGDDALNGPLLPGQFVEVEGQAEPGNFAPLVHASRVRVLAGGRSLTAHKAGWEKLSTGACDNDYVQVQGVIRSVRTVEPPQWDWKAFALHLDLGGSSLWVYLRNANELAGRPLIDAVAQVRAVCVVLSNRKRQFQGNALVVSRPGDVTILEPGPADPFDAPYEDLGNPFRFRPDTEPFRRVKLRGVVTMGVAGGLYLQEGNDAIFVQPASPTSAWPGDLVDVVGFPARSDFSPKLEDALVRVVGHGKELTPHAQTAAEVLGHPTSRVFAGNDGLLLRVTGRVVDIARTATYDVVVLSDGDSIFTGRYPHAAGPHLAGITEGDLISVTGVCDIQPDERGMPRSFELLMRSPSDLAVLKSGPWLTRSVALRGLVGVLAGLLLALLWVVSLRRRVWRQTRTIWQAKEQLEARVKERTAELQKTAELLGVSERRFRLAAENFPFLFLIYDGERRVRFLNQRGAELLGLEEDKVAGRRDEELFGEEGRKGCLPALQECAGTREPQVVECDVQLASGTYRVIANYVPVLDGDGGLAQILGIMTDITDRRRAEEALREKELFYRAIGDAVPDFIWSSTPSGEVRYANRRWQEYTGLTVPELNRNGWLNLVHPDDRSEIRHKWAEAKAAGGGFEVQFRYRRHDGVYRWFIGHVVPQKDESGGISQWVGSCTDIQRLKEAETELRRNADQLEQFAYAAAHDLQEPLRNISVYCELLERDAAARLVGDENQFLSIIRNSARRMSKLLEDLLQYSRALDTSTPTELVPFRNAVDHAMANLSQTIGESGAEVTIGSLPSLQVFEAHIVQLFQNLVGNAVKYRVPGVTPSICVTATPRNGDWLFSVRDNGLGISPEYHERIFRVFKRLHGREVAGTGIGLAICKRIVEHYGGTIWVESQAGAGANFLFTLPAQSA